MISLSDQRQYPETKVITLRSVQDIKQQIPAEQEVNLEEATCSKEKQLAALNDSLQQLTLEKEKKQNDIKETIAAEKLQWAEKKAAEKKIVQKEGYKSGYDEGKTDARLEYSQKLKEVNQLVQAAQEDYYRTVEQHQKAIVQLAITTARKIMNREIQTKEELALSFVKEAIEELKDTSHIHVYVHASKYQIMIDQKQELEQLIEDEAMLSIYVNKQLQEEECIIMHPFGQMEVGVDVQLKQIKDALAEKMVAEA